MPEQLLSIFNICLLVLLYLFFFRVLRAVWTEVSSVPVPGTPNTTPAAPKRATPKRRQRQPVAALPTSAGAPRTAGSDRPAVAASRSSAASPTELVAVDPAHIAGLRYALTAGMTFGRGGASSVIFDDNFLSQQHVAIEAEGNGWRVRDLGSTNGTFVNAVKLDGPVELAVGDRLQIGNIILEAR